MLHGVHLNAQMFFQDTPYLFVEIFAPNVRSRFVEWVLQNLSYFIHNDYVSELSRRRKNK